MIKVEGHDGHYSAAACASTRSTGQELPPGADKKHEPVKPGAPVLKIDDLKKYYRVGGNEVFGRRRGRVVKANESISFEARESETVAIVGESGCGKSTWPRCCWGWRPQARRRRARQ
jgi:peptide/nickel transport system ATP-binding protein